MQANEDAHTANPPSLSASAYEYLLLLLRSGHLGTAERLVEADIASQLGVSRVPVRQALLQLVAEGYLVSTPRGYRVPDLSTREIQDVFELRLLLEPRAAALAAREITKAQVRELDFAITDARAAHASGDAPGFFDAVQRFRGTWLGAVSNSRLAASITRYADQVLLVRRTTLARAERQRSVLAFYDQLRGAFARHDSLAASDLTVRLVLAAERDFSEFVARQ